MMLMRPWQWSHFSFTPALWDRQNRALCTDGKTEVLIKSVAHPGCQGHPRHRTRRSKSRLCQQNTECWGAVHTARGMSTGLSVDGDRVWRASLYKTMESGIKHTFQCIANPTSFWPHQTAVVPPTYHVGNAEVGHGGWIYTMEVGQQTPQTKTEFWKHENRLLNVYSKSPSSPPPKPKSHELAPE